MLLILEKDVRSFFSSYVAYAVTGMFLLIAGYFAFSSFLYFSLISFQLANNPFMGAERINPIVFSSPTQEPKTPSAALKVWKKSRLALNFQQLT